MGCRYRSVIGCISDSTVVYTGKNSRIDDRFTADQQTKSEISPRGVRKKSEDQSSKRLETSDQYCRICWKAA